MKVFRFGVAAAFLILNVSWPQWAMAALLPSAPVPAVSVVTTEGAELLSVTTQAASLSVILAEIAHQGGLHDHWYSLNRAHRLDRVHRSPS